MVLRSGTSIVLNAVKPHITLNTVICYIKRINVRSVVLFQKINANLILFIKMVIVRIKKSLI